MIATYELQASVRQRLINDSEFVALAPGGVHDGSAPFDVRKPYVVIGDAIERAENILTRIGRALEITITVWSDYEGKKEASLISSRAVRLLENQSLLSDNWIYTQVLFASANHGTDVLETQQRATLRFRITAQPR